MGPRRKRRERKITVMAPAMNAPWETGGLFLSQKSKKHVDTIKRMMIVRL
jgi:hypothetical protein